MIEPHPRCRMCAGQGSVRLPFDRHPIACPVCLARPAPVDTIASYSRGLRHGVLVGIAGGAALVAFALWIGVLQGQL